MKFVHRFGFRATASQRRELEALGVKLPASIALPGSRDPFVGFDVDEGHPNWPTLSKVFQEWNQSSMLRTEFSTTEVDSARWVEIGAWHHGYPQPDEDVFGYHQATYDLTDWCKPCGIGDRQKAPFQMTREPNWGRRGIMQLIWVYDELFVTPEVWAAVFKPHGIDRRPVTNTRGVELETVVQLVVEEEVGIVSDGLLSERCAKCGRVKYLPVTRGPFPALKVEPSRAIARTREDFGSGGQADHRVILAQEVARALATKKVRGAELRPVQSGVRP